MTVESPKYLFRLELLLRLAGTGVAGPLWVSYEPALEAVSFLPYFPRGLRWIVVGGESGRLARPFDIVWARQTIAQCRAAGVPVFVKQLGSFPVDCGGGQPFKPQIEPHGHAPGAGGEACRIRLRDSKGGDVAEWTAALNDIRIREFPGRRGSR